MPSQAAMSNGLQLLNLNEFMQHMTTSWPTNVLMPCTSVCRTVNILNG